MSTTLAGNLFALAGAVVMVLTGLLKTKRSILAAQNLQFLLMGIGNLFLGGISGMVSNLVSIFRNLFCLRHDYTKGWKIFFVIFQTGITAVFLYFSGFQLIELLPVAAAVLFTWFMDRDALTLKYIMCATLLLWFFYDINHINLSGAVFDILSIAADIYGIFSLRKKASACH